MHFDALILGSGQAGPFLAARLTAAGLSTALVEREHLGGTCLNDGCTPTKALVASARAAHIARHAADWGVTVGGPVGVDYRAVQARKDAIVGESVGRLTRWLEGMQRLTLLRGQARFTGPRSVRVGDAPLEADRVFVNVGARPVVPPWPGVESVPVLTHTRLLALDTLPEHLIVVGGSYVGLEFAQIYRRFGARVTVVEAGERIVAREDADVSAAVQGMLEGEGIAFVLGAHDPAFEHGGATAGGVVLQLQAQGRSHRLEGSHLLFAVGRRPNTDDLGLEAAGIATDARGFIAVDDELRTSVPGVWALGDCNGRGAFTHTSYNDHEIVAANLLDGEQRRVSDRITAYALYTDPPLARIGASLAEVRASGRAARVGTMPMTQVARARERGETQGFMRVVVDAESDRILGATLFCIEADEIVHALLDVMAAGAPARAIRRAVHIHPTVSELIPTLLQSMKPLQ